MSREPKISTSTGPLGLLTLLFIGLKLMGHIDWSWWLVLAPTLIPLGLLIILLLVATLTLRR